MVNFLAMITRVHRFTQIVRVLLVGAGLAVLLSAPLAVAGGASGAATWPGPLVDAAWLRDHLASSDLAVVEIGTGRFGASFIDFIAGHVPGAVYTSYANDGWRETDARGIPGQLPALDELERIIGGLGLSPDRGVVLVAIDNDAFGISAAARVYWTLKVAELDRLAILDGGKAAWRRLAGAPLKAGPASPHPTRFRAHLRADMILQAKDVARLQAEDGATLIDYRSPAEYRGDRPVPGTGARGTIPGAVNLHETRLLRANGRFLPVAKLRARYASVGVRTPATGPAIEIAFCTSGHRAALGWFVTHELLGRDSYLFDGSMEEWSRRARPVIPGRSPTPRPAPQSAAPGG